ncbi:hypothetical protein HZB69_04605 [Candidatus Amesbacteria bacterium]|nr:hypothetical protein [Candidatus Amesbacteria bacterium]
MLKDGSKLVGPNDPIYCAGSGAKYGGYSGYNTRAILDNPSWAESEYKADFVLIHLGTNDISSRVSTDTIISNLIEIIGRLRGNNPDVQIVLAKIIPLIGYDVNILNDAIGRSYFGLNVRVVDLYSGFNPKNLTDSVHPNSTGGLFIAQSFCQALGDICDPSISIKTITSDIERVKKTQLTLPGSPVPAECKVIGVNFAVESSVVGIENYNKAVENGMGWILVIADKGRLEATTEAVNRALARGLKPIIRIGSGHDAFGFSKDPRDYANYLNQVASKATGTFYAIAGPNEPDAEDWVVGHPYEIGTDGAPNTTVINDLGQILAEYMNFLIGNLKSPKIRLLSPSFNLSSWSGEYIIKAMLDNGANFGGLWGYSGNAYGLHSRVYINVKGDPNDIDIQTKKLIVSPLGYTLPKRPIVLTEFGNTVQDMKVLAEDVKRVKSGINGIVGALLFNAFDTNKWGWSHFAIKNFEEILGAECIQKVKTPPDLSKFLPPTSIPCDKTVDPEFHPNRPYPFNPCDPLIPSGAINAKDIAKPKDKKDYTTFACGNTLTPIKTSYFDAYGDNTNSSDLVCEKKGLKVTCWRSEEFDVTIDLSKANLGIISNTQDQDLTDEQKVNEYLNWYLGGSSQTVNFSGPLQKLLPRSFLNTAQRTLASTVNKEVHNYKSIFSNITLQNILKDIPYTSLEDAVGEYTISVYPPNAPGNPQDPSVVPPKGHNEIKELKLTIKSAEKAKK